MRRTVSPEGKGRDHIPAPSPRLATGRERRKPTRPLIPERSIVRRLRMLLPTLLLAHPDDLGCVVLAVPRRVAQRSVQADRVARLGVDEGAGEIMGRSRNQVG